MNLFGKDLSAAVAIIAEIGVNHEGDADKAAELIRLAAAAGADAVKLQSYTPNRYVSASDPARLERVIRFSLSQDDHRMLAALAADLRIAFLSTPVSEDWVPLLAELGSAIKIASGDLTFEPVIRAAARTGKPVILSTGLGVTEEVDQAVNWVRDEIADAPLDQRLILMHCVSAYPTPIEQANLLSIPFMAGRYGLTVGYSNHVIGMEAPLAAIALGAALVEVHFTDCKTGRTFRDHELSIEPADLALLVRQALLFCAARGRMGKTRQPCEAPNVAASRKGLVAARDLPEGTVLTDSDLAYARPATEFRADERTDLVGRRLWQALKAGELIPRNGVN